MFNNQIISSRTYTANDGAKCACGTGHGLFIVEYGNENGSIFGLPSLLQCQRCLSNARADAEWFSHH